MVYRTTCPSTSTYESVAKGDLAARMEKQICFTYETYLVRVELDLMCIAISYGYPLVEVLLAPSQQGKPCSICLIYEC